MEKVHKKSALMSKTKEQLSDLIMMLEHNNNVLHETLDTQAANYIKLTSWTPVSERLPGRKEYLGSDQSIYMKRMEVAYMTDSLEYKIGYYDGYKWMDKRHEKIVNVVAWKMHDPFNPRN